MASVSESGSLSVVATPIGNLEDMSPRAARCLAAVDLILAEDTRHSARLLDHLGVTGRVQALHEHNEKQQLERVLGLLQQGQHIALICDAGTPLISDPGFQLVRAAREAGVTVTSLPGPCAAVVALSLAGLPTDRFVFEGFPPAKRQARVNYLESLAEEPRTLVFYESPHRILESLKAMASVFGEGRRAVVARELTKAFESVYDNALGALVETLTRDSNARRGEFVVVVEGAPEAGDSEHASVAVAQLLARLLEEMPVKKAVRLVADLTGHSRNALYQQALEMRSE